MSSWFLLIIVTMVLGFGTQAYINSSYRKYASVPNESGLTGAQIARRMLDDNGLQHVQVRPVAGSLSDHYDPRTQVVSLSEGVYDQASVSAMAIACHECGHAVQHARGYAAMEGALRARPRSQLRLERVAHPAAHRHLPQHDAAFLAGHHLLRVCGALPDRHAACRVQRLASRPCLHHGFEFGRRHGITQALAIPGDATADGARTVLRAAALTYVAAALTSVLQLLYFLGMVREN